MKRIAIIGGGASGLMAAVTAAESEDCEIFLLEKQQRVGRKILSTGNGRCNLTNTDMKKSRYHGTGSDLAWELICGFGPKETLGFFRRYGLITVEEPGGRVYPFSDKANSVLDVLRAAVNRNNIHIICGADIAQIRYSEGQFSIVFTDGSGKEQSVTADRLAVCCGGTAQPKLGATRDGYSILTTFGHSLIEPHPSLVRLTCRREDIKGLKGVRQDCAVTLLDRNGKILAGKTGEVQFTENGLSGPCIFDLSRYVSTSNGKKSALLDLMPEMSHKEAVRYIENKKKVFPDTLSEELFTGMFHSRVGLAVVAKAGIRSRRKLGDLSEREVSSLADAVKSYEVREIAAEGMAEAQVAAGGIDVREFTDRLESRKAKGLFAAGEVLDVDGDCGGYNLQWAWTSGHVIGKAMSE